MPDIALDVEATVRNPRRVAAGRRNRELRRGLTDAGRERLRESTSRYQPWRFATGPRTDEGKRQVATNGKVRQIGSLSVRERRALMAELTADLKEFRQLRGQVAGKSEKKQHTKLTSKLNNTSLRPRRSRGHWRRHEAVAD